MAGLSTSQTDALSYLLTAAQDMPRIVANITMVSVRYYSAQYVYGLRNPVAVGAA